MCPDLIKCFENNQKRSSLVPRSDSLTQEGVSMGKFQCVRLGSRRMIWQERSEGNLEIGGKGEGLKLPISLWPIA